MKFRQALLVLVLLAVGIGGLMTLTASKPEIEKKKRLIPAPMVRVTTVSLKPVTVQVIGEGTVHPLREIDLAPQVSGKLVEVSPSLAAGGEFKKGDLLARINPVDYELALASVKAQVKDAESNLKQAAEETAVSREEWRLHRNQAGPAPPLVAKEPQLAAAQAKVEAYRAELKQARLNLERTRILAPFDGRVSQKTADLGQYVTPGQVLAEIFSTEAAEIIVPLEDRDLFWIQVPGFTIGEGLGSKAEIRAHFAGRNMTWAGQVVRAEGKLDEKTRMINVVVRVEHPYGSKPPLAVGLYVTVEIVGQALDRGTVIPRGALRDNDIVWVAEPGDQKDLARLVFRKVEVARNQGDQVVITSGLDEGDRVIITSLKAATDGMKVRVPTEDDES